MVFLFINMEDNSRQYGQQDFNLPHDVVTLPSQGKFYKNKKKSLKIGYLTAQDENVLASVNKDINVIHTLVKNKVYEPDFRVEDLIESDLETILIFLRNTSFGTEYNFTLTDPKTNKSFEKTINLDRLDITEPKITPNNEGLFEIDLPKSKAKALCKILTVGEIEELNKVAEKYPQGIVAPIVTNKLEKQIVSIDGNTDREYISKFVINLPISDSKLLRNTISDCEPKLNLRHEVTAPSGEKVNVRITFGAEFFRPFF
jgi:hypothetical protein